ncbi:MAG: hypothetical protein WDO19_09240 [Bacteroidota bacterium]
MKGYQADIDGANTYTGQNYEERGRGFLAMRGQIAELKAGEKTNYKRLARQFRFIKSADKSE